MSDAGSANSGFSHAGNGIGMPTLTRASDAARALQDDIRARTARVCIVGMGYVGLPAGARLPRRGLPRPRVRHRRLQDRAAGGRTQLHRADARCGDRGGCWPKVASDRRLIQTCSPTPTSSSSACRRLWRRKSAIRICQFVVADGSPSGSRRICASAQLVVLESTTYPGTTARRDSADPRARERSRRRVSDFFVAYSPGAGRPGQPRLHGQRHSQGRRRRRRRQSRELACRPLRKCRGRRRWSRSRRAEVAEACKILENTYRAVNIALVNELKVRS